MKKTLIYLSLAYSLIIPMVSNAQENIDLFIIAGQSNAQGYKTSGVDYPADPNNYDPSIKFNWTCKTYNTTMSSTGWTTMGKQTHHLSAQPIPGVKKYFGPEVTFSRKLKEAGYNPAIFKYVRPAAGMDIWLGTEDEFEDMKTALNTAITALENQTQGNIVTVKGFIWIQGEDDSDNWSEASIYQANLESIIDDLRIELEIPTLPVVLGVNEIYPGYYINNSPYIQGRQQLIADADSKIIRSSTLGLTTVIGDNAHFSSAGVIEHGERLFNDYMSLIDSPVEQSNWEMIWYDEFGGTSLDINKWKYGVENGRYEEWFNSNNVSVSDGNLILKANQETNGTKPYGGSEITTKMLPSDATANFKYGYYEARIKVPDGKVFFPAFWLSVKNGGNSTWPPEIDMVEYSADGNKKPHGTNQLIACEESGSFQDRGYYLEASEISDPSSNYHIYGAEWNEFEIKWFIDNVQVDTTKTEQVPHDFFRIVLSLQLNKQSLYNAEWIQYDLNDINKKMYVDWVRVWKPVGAPIEGDYDKWDRVSHSADTEILGEWNLNDDDTHIIGDFTHDGIDEVLSLSSSRVYAKLHQYDNIIDTWSWTKKWGNNENSAIGAWNLHTTDQYLSGNFDGTGDKLLCIDNVYVKLLAFNETTETWSTTWGNGGNSLLGDWNTGTGDRYFVFDFDNNDIDDIICFSSNSQSCKIITYATGVWTTLYGNGSTLGQIYPVNNASYWNMSSSDIYKVGDFNGDGLGELLIINEIGGYSKLYEYNNNGGMNYIWGNGGGFNFGNDWGLSNGSRYYTYNMDSDSKTELFCISPDNKYEKILNFSGSNWYTGWGNNGSYQIYNRDITNNDQFLFGNYSTSTSQEVLWIKPSWSFDITNDDLIQETKSCGTTVYLHKTPTISPLRLSNQNLEEDNKELLTNKFKIYPNPNNGQFVIDLDEDENVMISIYNIQGQQIHSNLNASGKVNLNLSRYPQGIYFVKIVSGNNAVVERIIKE